MPDTLFSKLTQDRKSLVDALRKAGMLEVFISHIVDTYRESAHFIFELFQNADDAGATSVRLELENDGVVFAHNGATVFSLTDVDEERAKGVVPGHINAITTFSLSTKREDVENKIGKFGIGFKSVFQYTATPHVYNPPFCFKITDYMVPHEIERPTDLAQGDETTALWSPFHRADIKRQPVSTRQPNATPKQTFPPPPLLSRLQTLTP